MKTSKIYIRYYLSFAISFLLFSCNQIETKTEKLISDEVRDQMINKQVCDGVSIIDLKFDNSPDDNSGTNFTLSGVATLTEGVERQINLEGDISENENWKYSFGDETEESIRKRFFKLLTTNSFLSNFKSNSVPYDMNFETENSGYYHSKDGDKYNFDYDISNIHHTNDFKLISSNGSNCDDLLESIDFLKQSYEANFNMSNNRFTFSGTIKINGPDSQLDISGEIEDNESSRVKDINWTMYMLN